MAESPLSALSELPKSELNVYQNIFWKRNERSVTMTPENSSDL